MLADVADEAEIGFDLLVGLGDEDQRVSEGQRGEDFGGGLGRIAVAVRVLAERGIVVRAGSLGEPGGEQDFRGAASATRIALPSFGALDFLRQFAVQRPGRKDVLISREQMAGGLDRLIRPGVVQRQGVANERLVGRGRVGLFERSDELGCFGGRRLALDCRFEQDGLGEAAVQSHLGGGFGKLGQRRPSGTVGRRRFARGRVAEAADFVRSTRFATRRTVRRGPWPRAYRL